MTVELSSAPLSFNSVKDLIQESTSITNLIDAIDQTVGDFVNVEVYVESTDSVIEEIPTRYSFKRKREVLIHDASCTVPIRFAIWNANIDAMPTSGTNRLMDVKINSFNGKYITTTANTVVSVSATSALQPMEVSQPKINNVMSPAKTIDLFEQIYYCPKCNQKSLLSDGPFLMCQNLEIPIGRRTYQI